jgi:hypothetical protein
MMRPASTKAAAPLEVDVGVAILELEVGRRRNALSGLRANCAAAAPRPRARPGSMGSGIDVHARAGRESARAAFRGTSPASSALAPLEPSSTALRLFRGSAAARKLGAGWKRATREATHEHGWCRAGGARWPRRSTSAAAGGVRSRSFDGAAEQLDGGRGEPPGQGEVSRPALAPARPRRSSSCRQARRSSPACPRGALDRLLGLPRVCLAANGDAAPARSRAMRLACASLSSRGSADGRCGPRPSPQRWRRRECAPPAPGPAARGQAPLSRSTTSGRRPDTPAHASSTSAAPAWSTGGARCLRGPICEPESRCPARRTGCCRRSAQARSPGSRGGQHETGPWPPLLVARGGERQHTTEAVPPPAAGAPRPDSLGRRRATPRPPVQVEASGQGLEHAIEVDRCRHGSRRSCGARSRRSGHRGQQ